MYMALWVRGIWTCARQYCWGLSELCIYKWDRMTYKLAITSCFDNQQATCKWTNPRSAETSWILVTPSLPNDRHMLVPSGNRYDPVRLIDMYTYAHVSANARTHAHIHAHTDTHMNAHTHSRKYTHKHQHTHTHTHIQTYTHIHIYTSQSFHPIPLPCALAFPPPSHRDANTLSPC